MTDDPSTNVQYSCFTAYSSNPVNAVLECGNGETLEGQTINGNPFMGTCNYSTPTN